MPCVQFVLDTCGSGYDVRADCHSRHFLPVKTKQAIIVGVYNDKAQPGEAAKIVEGLADYLISVSY